MLSETGHYTGTFRLARALRARGHRVIYLGTADFRELVESQGFEFIAFAGDLIPCGNPASSQRRSGRGIFGRLRKRLLDERYFARYLRLISNGNLDECLLSCKPNLLLCDTFVWYVAMRALRLGIPTMNISIILSLYANAHIPPIVSSISPKQSWSYNAQVMSAWIWLRLKFFFTKRLASILFGTYRFPTRMHHLIDVFLQIARRSGYPRQENKTYWFGEMGPRLILPEFVLCPEAFQLPRCPEDGRQYLGDFVDIERREQPLPADKLDQDKPLVYCSLGTAASFYPHARRFFQAVFEAAELKKEWQFVLHLGNYCHSESCPQPGANLLVLPQVPQLALLKSASVMVTHGGMNSIMECVHFKVPMVIVPGLRDQPGNAVRAAYHNLALTAPMAKITPALLVDLIGRAMADVSLKQGLVAMKKEIARESGMENVVRFIEQQGGRLYPSGSPCI